MVAWASVKSEEELARGLLCKDAEALAGAYDQYGALTYSILLRVTRDHGTAEDLLQEVFLRVWTRIHDYDATRGSLGVWIASIARNRAIDFLRSSNVRIALRFQPMPQVETRFGKLGHGEATIENADLVRKLFAQVTIYQRQILEMAYFEGCSQSEIAARLHTPLGTIKSQIRLAVQQLRIAYSAGNDAYTPPVSEQAARRA